MHLPADIMYISPLYTHLFSLICIKLAALVLLEHVHKLTNAALSAKRTRYHGGRTAALCTTYRRFVGIRSSADNFCTLTQRLGKNLGGVESKVVFTSRHTILINCLQSRCKYVVGEHYEKLQKDS